MSAVQRRTALLALTLALLPTVASAQTPNDTSNAATASAAAWSYRATASTYVVPDDENYVQPTVAADHGRLHLEGRFNYEDRNSTSTFVGWNFEVGSRVTLELTPMFGAVLGNTEGVIPALELTLGVGPIEFYSEGEYVIDVTDLSNRYFFSWSELTVSPTKWLRAGVVTQRTRVVDEPRDIQPGILAGATFGKFNAAFYYFNPGSSDHYAVVSLGVTF